MNKTYIDTMLHKSVLYIDEFLRISNSNFNVQIFQFVFHRIAFDYTAMNLRALLELQT